MYIEPCARLTKFMMPKTSVRPAAMRNSNTPSCRPLSAWMMNRLKLTIRLSGPRRAAGAARGLSSFQGAQLVEVRTGGDVHQCRRLQHGLAAFFHHVDAIEGRVGEMVGVELKGPAHR